VAAGHQSAVSLASFTFTGTLGVAAATAVRVGLAVGRGDRRGARLAGFVGLGAAAAFMSCAAVVLFTARRALARSLTDDPSVIAVAAPLIAVAAVFQLSDGTQSVAAGALRGAGDTRAPLHANLVGHYAVGLPVAVALGFGTRLGPTGLWWGLSSGLTAVAVALAARFAALSSREIARV
jgi:MATE family multidrug resistance protein